MAVTVYQVKQRILHFEKRVLFLMIIVTLVRRRCRSFSRLYGDFVRLSSRFANVDKHLVIQLLFFRYRPILLNGLFIAYLILGQPRLMERLNASQDGRGDWMLGGLLLAVPLLEVLGILLKHPVSAYFEMHYPRQGSSTYLILVYILAAIFRLALGPFFVMVAFQVGGGKPTGQLSDGLQMLMALMVLLVIFKEVVVIALAFPKESMVVGNKALQSSNLPLERWLEKVYFGRAAEKINLKAALRDLLGDLLLLVFSALVYTAMWEFIIQIDAMRMDFLDYLGLTFFFLLVFLPLRMTGLVGEMTTQTGKWQRVISVASLTVVWLAEMLRLH